MWHFVRLTYYQGPEHRGGLHSLRAWFLQSQIPIPLYFNSFPTHIPKPVKGSFGNPMDGPPSNKAYILTLQSYPLLPRRVFV